MIGVLSIVLPCIGGCRDDYFDHLRDGNEVYIAGLADCLRECARNPGCLTGPKKPPEKPATEEEQWLEEWGNEIFDEIDAEWEREGWGDIAPSYQNPLWDFEEREPIWRN
jgi:hypothetical protein